MWRVDQAVAALQQLLAEVVLQLLPDDAALRVPEGKPLAVLLLDREEVELAAETAVVASLGLLTLVQPRVQLRRRREGGAVDALHLGAFDVALPVGAREREELEGAESVGARHVRAQAEVDEGGAVDVVDAHPLVSLVLDQLALQRLVAPREDAQRLGLRELLATVGEAALCQLAHASLDRREIGVRERARGDHVVEEAEAGVVQHGRADAELRSREEFDHRRGQEVSGGMAEHAETLESARHNGLDLHDGNAGLVRPLEAAAQIDRAAVDPRREGMPGDVSPELLERFADGGAGAYVSPRQILDVDAHVVHLSPPSRSRAPRKRTRPAITCGGRGPRRCRSVVYWVRSVAERARPVRLGVPSSGTPAG